jgi:hypothetical protein
MNVEEDAILMEIGQILYKQGLIESTTRHAITKFLLRQAINGFKEELRRLSNARGEIGTGESKGT